MSLYNALLGKNDRYKEILELVDLNEGDIERFRDAYLSEDARIVKVYTRTGGPNRSSYQTFINWMKTYSTYIKDYDDDFDNTFMTFEFRVPGDMYGKALELLKDTDTRTGQQKFEDLMKSLEDGSGWEDPKVKKVTEQFDKIFSQEVPNKSILSIDEEGNITEEK